MVIPQGAQPTLDDFSKQIESKLRKVQENFKNAQNEEAIALSEVEKSKEFKRDYTMKSSKQLKRDGWKLESNPDKMSQFERKEGSEFVRSPRRSDKLSKGQEKALHIKNLRNELEEEIKKEVTSLDEKKKIAEAFKAPSNPLLDLESTKFKTKEQMKIDKRILFRKKHVCTLLETYFARTKPLPIDRLVSQYFKEHREIDAPKNRNFIKSTIFGIIRYRLTIEYFYSKYSNPRANKWEEKMRIYEKLSEYLAKEPNLPKSLQVSAPSFVYELFEKDYGTDKALEIATVLNEEAPIYARVNTLKISREKLIETLKGKDMIVEAGNTPDGIVFGKRYPITGLHEYTEGNFEMQDESSQIAASLLKPKKGQLILDYCCGSGGKSLAFGSKMDGKGQIYLCDVRPEILKEAKRRFAKAGVQNINPLMIGAPHLEKMINKMDQVFCDLPCTGSGTFRRNPDQKYRIDASYLESMVKNQREIFEKALNYLKPGGLIVYSVCSIFKDEGERQIEYLEKTHGLKRVSIAQSLPISGGMDGYFACLLKSPDFKIVDETKEKSSKTAKSDVSKKGDEKSKPISKKKYLK